MICKTSVQLLASNRCFKKKMGLKLIYDMYDRDTFSPTEYMLVYNGTGETYVRCLSGIIVILVIAVPSVYIYWYGHILFTKGYIDLNGYLNSFCTVLALIKLLASYSFPLKYVIRNYKHNTKRQYAGVIINLILPWKNIICIFNKAIKFPNGKFTFVPWYKEYYDLDGHKSIKLS